MVRFVNQASASLVRFCKDEEAASAVEYGLLASLIAAAIILAVTQLGGTLTGVFNKVNAGIS